MQKCNDHEQKCIDSCKHAEEKKVCEFAKMRNLDVCKMQEERAKMLTLMQKCNIVVSAKMQDWRTEKQKRGIMLHRFGNQKWKRMCDPVHRSWLV